jgi:hypothetical protein
MTDEEIVARDSGIITAFHRGVSYAEKNVEFYAMDNPYNEDSQPHLWAAWIAGVEDWINREGGYIVK